MLSIEGGWVWDFWLADDGQRFHAFFLHAPSSLGDEERRHRAARIGHAVTDDLMEWECRSSPLSVGVPGSFDETATWTGCVVRGDDGRWRMFYTGARFLAAEPAIANIQTIGVAVSDDLQTWDKLPGPIVAADPRWYETWGSSDWKEEAWRDPWVFRDPSGEGWHMLVTARANDGALDDRGVIGHAYSSDLETWVVRPPLTAPGSGFAHLEVPQVELVEGQWVLLFSSAPSSLSAGRAASVGDAGTWAVVIDDPTQPFDVSAATPLTTEDLYSGRLVRQRDGRWVFLAFNNNGPRGHFIGGVSDPIGFHVDDDRRPTLSDSPARYR